jgi:hypothetical protein
LPLSREKSLAQVRRHDRAKVVTPAEDAIANTCDKIVNRVAQDARNNRQNSGEHPPRPTEAAQDVQKGVRAHQKPPVLGKDDYAIGQARPAIRGNLFDKRRTLQRREAERGAGAITFEDKLHGAMAKTAMAVVKEDFG